MFEDEFTLREALVGNGRGKLDWTTASDLVASLVAKSLVVPIANAGPEPRFRLPATIRAYARAKLAESNEVKVPNGHRLTGRNRQMNCSTYGAVRSARS